MIIVNRNNKDQYYQQPMKTMPIMLLILAIVFSSSNHNLFVRGAVREYTWVITGKRSRAWSPDCFTDRDMLLVNDEIPSPPLFASVGDTVRITLINEHPTEAVTMHYHGIHMMDQPYSDGAHQRSQCILGPMQTQVNEFYITPHDVGTHYYHGHVSMDRVDGLQGAIIIDDPMNEEEMELEAQYDEERIIFIQDWYHRYGASLRVGLDSVPFNWVLNPQTMLINGKGQYGVCIGADETTPNCALNCIAENYITPIDVEAGKTYRFRIINAASLTGLNFGIDGHAMTVVEAEGTILDPVVVDTLDIGVAQRYSVLVTADADPNSSYWGRTVVRFRNGGPEGLMYLRYSADAPPPPNSTGPFPSQPTWDDVPAWDNFEPKLTTKSVSRWPASSALNATTVRQIILVGTQNTYPVTGQLKWAVNNITEIMPAEPIIYSAYKATHSEGALSWPNTEMANYIEIPDTPPNAWNHTNKIQDEGLGTNLDSAGVSIIKLSKGDVVDIIFQNALALNGVAEAHWWHTHGMSFWVIGYGEGTFDPETDPENFNLINPVRRDTLTILPNGWTAIRLEADNPGAWPCHCVISAHLTMGMGFTFIISPDLLEPPPPGALSCLKNSLLSADHEVCSPLFDLGSGPIPNPDDLDGNAADGTVSSDESEGRSDSPDESDTGDEEGEGTSSGWILYCSMNFFFNIFSWISLLF